MSEQKEHKIEIVVVGLGRAGGRIVGALHQLPGSESMRLLAVDTDAASLRECGIPEEMCVLADEKWRNGRGCGSDVLKGQRSMARERAKIEALISDARLLIMVGGLGGGTATGGAPAFAGVAGKLKIPSVFVMTMPFSLEGHGRRRVAEEGIRELLPVADVLLCLPNDLLFSSLPAEVPVYDAFKMADVEVAGAINGISRLLRPGNLLTADFADFDSVIAKRKSFCSIGFGSATDADGLNRCHLALERMLDSPLLGGAEKLRQADAVFLSLSGGTSLNIGETKKTFEAAAKFISERARVIVSANVDSTCGDSVQLTAIAIKFDEEQQPDPSLHRSNSYRAEEHTSKPKVPQPPPLSGNFEQVELPLQNISRGMFLNTTPVIHNGEDLDVPTFQRRNIFIDQGN